MVSPSSGGGLNQKVKIGVIVLLAVIVMAGVAYVLTRKSPEAGPEVVTPSGLRMTDLKVGDGATPTMGQTVTVNYVGRFENGEEFDSSYKRGVPATFSLGPGLIEGWNEALQTMKVGGKRKLFVPSKLGYGATGKPPRIPPNTNLEFEIELMGIR